MSEQDRRERSFVATAAHELRTPVAAIHGIASTLVERADMLDASQVQALHEMLLVNSQRLAALINEVLDLSRADIHAVEIAPVPLDVRARVAELVAGLGGDINSGDITSEDVSIEVDPALRPLVDPAAFDRIVGNLIGNALRHGTAPVTVSAGIDGEVFRLSVEDRGAGVDPDFVPKLFDPFSRSPGAARGGAGLGLAIAAAYARAHGGTVTYEDAEPQGARFVLLLAGQ